VISGPHREACRCKRWYIDDASCLDGSHREARPVAPSLTRRTPKYILEVSTGGSSSWTAADSDQGSGERLARVSRATVSQRLSKVEAPVTATTCRASGCKVSASCNVRAGDSGTYARATPPAPRCRAPGFSWSSRLRTSAVTESSFTLRTMQGTRSPRRPRSFASRCLRAAWSRCGSRR
jgi:hypothetical protein